VSNAKIGVVVGNPKPASRTLAAALALVEDLGHRDVRTLDLAEFGSELLTYPSAQVDEAVASVQSLDLLVVASPTYKATYTGLLKLFLERFETGSGLAGVVAVPLMLGGSAHHSLAPELHLKPLLVELGATCPTEALYLLDRPEQGDPRRREWVARWAPTLGSLVTSLR
jgi:FMN reductase